VQPTSTGNTGQRPVVDDVEWQLEVRTQLRRAGKFEKVGFKTRQELFPGCCKERIHLLL